MMLPNFIFRIECWKFNKDFGVYVSTEGHFKDRYKRLIPVRVEKRGYVRVETEKGFILAHRLVMFTWRPIPNAEALTVDHLDHNKRNNSLSNLEWVTKEENLRRAKIDFLKEDKYEEQSAIPIAFGVEDKWFETIEEAFRYIKKNTPKDVSNNMPDSAILTKKYNSLIAQANKGCTTYKQGMKAYGKKIHIKIIGG